MKSYLKLSMHIPSVSVRELGTQLFNEVQEERTVKTYT
jgi:hypothetical protein